jgi:hypothetical protein
VLKETLPEMELSMPFGREDGNENTKLTLTSASRHSAAAWHDFRYTVYKRPEISKWDV